MSNRGGIAPDVIQIQTTAFRLPSLQVQSSAFRLPF